MRKAHHPCRATLVHKNNNAHVGAGLVSAQNRGITLIALVITIIVLLILAGVTISLTLGEDGIFKIAEQATKSYDEASAREKLEQVLAELQAKKVIDTKYNNTTYIDEKIKENEMMISGNIVVVEKWQFEIDREELKVVTSLGKETAEHLYISNAKELQELSDKVNAGENFEGVIIFLTQDIELNTVCGSTLGNWNKVIGNNENTPFKGTFEGYGKTIKNIYINNGTEGQCLFGYNEGTIKNLQITGQNTNTTGASGICYTNKGTIENCINACSLGNSGKFSAAGIAFYNKGTVKKCTNTGNVLSSKTAEIGNFGGIVGNNTGIIEDCINTGRIEGYNAPAGIAGNNTGIIRRCINKGTIQGTGYAGGIAGHNIGGGIIYNSYNIADATGNHYIGGIAGYNGYSGKSYIYNCYSINKTNIVGGSANSSIEQNCYTTGMTAGSLNNGIDDIETNKNTESPWQEDVTPNINGGYPILKWQLESQ